MHTDLLHLQRYHDSGDAREFQALVKHHASMVFATARRVTQDSSLAEDVAQETFLELARKGRSISESVGAWLHRVAWRRACDLVRAEKRRQRYESATAVFDKGHECTWEELEPVFDEAISELAEEERTVIIEHYLEGRSQMDIARRIGLSQSSVSRLLDKSIEELRTKLKSKGLFCGLALSGMMTVSSQAAPASLVTSLYKIGLSNIGSGVAEGMLTGLSLKTLVSYTLIFVGCALTYDLASADSRLSQWLAPHDKQSRHAPGKSADAADTKARLMAEAKNIWDKKPKIPQAELDRLMRMIVFEKEVEKRFAAMHAAGLLISRAAYDRIVTRHPDIHLYDERKAGHAQIRLSNALLGAWILESPREAVVWASLKEGPASNWFPALIAPWVRNHPEEWAAFVEAGPDPRLGDYARLWVESLDDPGSIWARGKEIGMDLSLIQANLDALIMMEGWTPDAIFRMIMHSPQAKERNESLVGIALNLSNEQLLEAANSGIIHDSGLVNTLRAMGGDPNTAFKVAGDWVTKAANGGGNEGQLARWTEELVGRFYAQWLKVDPRAALQHSKRSQNEILLESFMKEGAKSAMLNEAMIVEAFSSPKNREHSLAAYYLAKADGDPEKALQSIMNSSYVEDQIESASQVLTQWAVKSAPDAAAWLAALPASEGRTELISAVASKWAETAPEEAFAFTQQQGVGLAHGWANGLAWGARVLSEEKLATMFAALREDPKYNTLVINLVGVRFPSHPQKALAFLSKHAKPGWQAPLVQDMIRWLKGDDARAEEFAILLPTMDLSQVDPKHVTNAAQLLVHRVASEGKIPAAFDWTLKLPDSIAQQARSETIAQLDLANAQKRGIMEHWIRTAAISESERVTLLNQTSQPRN